MTPRISDAQKRALLGIPVKRAFRPCHTGFQWPTLSRLKALRLINSVLDGVAGLGPNAMHVITPRGLRLREELINSGAPFPPRTGPAARTVPTQAGGGNVLNSNFHDATNSRKGR